MQTALIGSALLMGLAGGPHCVAMCGAACAGVIRFARAPAGGGVAVRPAPAVPAAVLFHAARLASYAAGGALAASAVQGLAFASEQVALLRPLWLLLHVAVFAWGLLLAVAGRQPLWAHSLGRLLAKRLRPAEGSRWRVLATGALWVSMPCGLLYSALMLAALGNDALQGAVVMAAFAAGSGIALLVAPWLWRRLHSVFGASRREWGTRLAGAVLAVVALRAVWHDLGRQIAVWCQ